MAAADARLPRILAAQLAALAADPHPHLLARPDPGDVRVWHFLAAGLDAPYLGGEYLFRLTAPADFPARPPSFEALTPNGVYLPGGPVCISIGEFHADDPPGPDGAHGWRPALGMQGFAAQVINGLICADDLGADSVRVVQHPPAIKTEYARHSRAWNARSFPALAAEFDAEVEALLAAPAPCEPAVAVRDGRLRLAGQPVPARGPPPPRRAPGAAPAAGGSVGRGAAPAADDSVALDAAPPAPHARPPAGIALGGGVALAPAIALPEPRRPAPKASRAFEPRGAPAAATPAPPPPALTATAAPPALTATAAPPAPRGDNLAAPLGGDLAARGAGRPAAPPAGAAAVPGPPTPWSAAPPVGPEGDGPRALPADVDDFDDLMASLVEANEADVADDA